MHNIVLVGVGGTGMSALASLFLQLGYTNVVGIDAQHSELTESLRRQGAEIIIGHGNYAMQHKDFVIYSDIESIKHSPEMQQSFAYSEQHDDPKRYHKPFSYNEFLAEISKYFTTIAVAGSNGKSSTTAMAIKALYDAPDFGIGIVGALMIDFDNHNCVISSPNINKIRAIIHRMLTGKGNFDYSLVKKFFFVVEACEYKEHFLLLDADYTLITNIDRDHVDYFQTEQSYVDAFKKIINQTKQSVITHDPVVQQLDVQIDTKIRCAQPYTGSFDHVFGAHYFANAALVSTLVDLLQQGNSAHLQQFRGLRRRMELLMQTPHGTIVYSDYAHHGPAIRAGLAALHQKYPTKKISVVFQPHQAQRLLQYRDEFLESLHTADEIYIYKLYTARENRSDIAPKAHQRISSKVASFDDIGTEFAAACQGTYIIDSQNMRDTLQQKQADTVVVLFTAGNLDYDVRTRNLHT